MGVMVINGGQRGMSLDDQPDFFEHFTFDAVGGSFVGFDFSAGELPVAGEDLIGLAL